ncbi:EAL domain-containing protein [Halothiobacillus sp.]|uniref:EAL domain-containing protein n=1 Tax=Halothiobacillus sp. TaxID=1891311 RepID=UPI00261BA5D7|nr:EAL domain-containing protein [Halothiobacillus sp.]
MRIVPLSLQFLMFLGLQVALSLGLVFYLNILATNNYQSFQRASSGFVESSKTIEILRKSFAATSAEIEHITSQFSAGKRVDVRDQVLALQQVAAAIRTDTALAFLREAAGSQVMALSKSIDQQAQALINAATATASATPAEVKDIQSQLRNERSRILVDDFGALINAANQNLENTMTLLRGSTKLLSSQYQTLLILFIVLQIALMMTALWYFNHQIKQLADITERLIDGEATAALPQQKRHDQIGRLARAVQHFRTTLITLSDSREQLKAILKKHDQETLSRRKAEQQLALTASVFENVQEAVLLTDISGYVTRANAVAQEMLHSTEKQLAAKPLLEFLLGHDAAVLEPLWRQVLEQGYWSGEVDFTPENAPTITAMISIKLMGEAREGRGHVIFVLNDHTEIRAREAKMRFLAEQDTVTGLFNRHYFIAQGEKRIAKHPNLPFSIVLIGIDNFRSINDALGHHDGDQVLVEIGRALAALLPASAVLAHIDGDEFAFYWMPKDEHKQKEELREFIERTLAATREPLHINGYQITLKVSAGTSTYPNDGETIDVLIKTSLIALSMARSEGGDRLYMQGAQAHDLAQRRFMLQQALGQALSNRELRLDYQPQVSLANGHISGFEVLMRWRHGGEWVSPSEFIPLAEESDTIVRITEWAFVLGATRIREWQRQTQDTFSVSINLPPRLLLIDKIDERLSTAAKQTGLPLSSITLEVTESSFGSDPDLMSDQLHRLAMQGFTIAIDDFGTGYSSLAYLSTLPVSKIKIDKKFIDPISQSAEARKLLKSIFAMAESLELDIVVEGVETTEQLILLKQFNVRMSIQGFVFDQGQNEDFWEGLFLKGKPHLYDVPDLRVSKPKTAPEDNELQAFN